MLRFTKARMLRTRISGLLAALLAFSGLVMLLSATAASAGVTKAVSTTTNVTASTGNGACLNGGPNTATGDPTNCNIYSAKEDVWLSGLPTDLADGTYFLAVLDPGGQNDPNDGSAGLLSTDSQADRTFTLSNGQITSASTHEVFNNRVQLAPYTDTTNPGGVYILAVCAYTGSPVDPSFCKFDAFKVKTNDVPDALPLTIVKDANGAYDNKYTWATTKSVDKTTVRQIGGSATFNYTVTAGHDMGTISNVTVAGTITVFNPNAGAVGGVDVTDVLSNGTVCAVTGGSDATVATGDNHFAYRCELSSKPQAQLDNTASVTWVDQAVNPDGFLIGGAADFTFSNVPFTENPIDECTNVNDSFAGALGQVCVGDANPKSFLYSRAIPVPANDCQSYDNTATFITTDTGATGSASQTVTVCGPAKTGALTIGFWKNTNGQGLVKSYCQNPALGNYLKGLGGGSGPYANAPVACSDLATYVSNILNGTSATNMNVMLRAQMLSTALDVWFSGPGWTATKIGTVKPPSSFLSHNNLGTFKMNTMAVCPMVDNTTTGTATCKNNTPSTDAVASGALPTSPMAMQAILDFASTTSTPFNGSTSSSVWYAGDRTKQEILKNVYDQFNNQLAFGSF